MGDIKPDSEYRHRFLSGDLCMREFARHRLEGIDEKTMWVPRSPDGVNWDGSTPNTWRRLADWLALQGIPDDNNLYQATSSDLGETWSTAKPILKQDHLTGRRSQFSKVPQS